LKWRNDVNEMDKRETPGFDPVGAARENFIKTSLPGLMELAAKERPGVGTTVKVLHGKHKNKVGVVFWHGPQPHFYSHMDDLSDCMRQARGVYGFRVGIKTEAEKFFVDADNVEICRGA